MPGENLPGGEAAVQVLAPPIPASAGFVLFDSDPSTSYDKDPCDGIRPIEMLQSNILSEEP